MYLLHIETATSICSVALSRENEWIAGRSDAGGMKHASMLSPMIQEVMEQADVSMKQLSGIAVSAGPGSYTGLRVGVSTARAMAYSLNIPMVGVSTLTALAWAAKTKHPQSSYFLPMLDARRMEVYSALYDDQLQPIWKEQAVIVDEAFIRKLEDIQVPIVVCGDGAMKLKSRLAGLEKVTIDEEISCDARHLIQPGWALLKGNTRSDVFHFTPTYLKAPNITTPKKPV